MGELQNLLRAWLRQALSLIGTSLESLTETPTRVVQVLRFEGEGRVTADAEERPDLSIVAHSHYGSLENSPEMEGLVNFIRENGWLRQQLLVDMGGSPVNESGHGWWVMNTVTMPLLTRYLNEAQEVEWDSNLFDRLLSDLETYLIEDTFPVAVTAPLSNLESTLDEYQFADNLVVRPISEEERSQLWSRFGSGPLSSPWIRFDDLVGWSYAAVARLETPKRTPTDLGPALEQIEKLVSALRLCGDGKFGVAQHWSEPERPIFEVSGIRLGGSVRPPIFRGPKYQLTDEVANEAREVLGLLEQDEIREDRSFQLALRRFNQGYERLNHNDAIIDCWVALEALFLPDSRQELRYRASLRIARFLGVDSDERIRLFRGAKDSYDLRSAIVHGADLPDNETRDIASTTEHLLRRALRRWVDPSQSRDINEIDEELLR